MNTIPSLNPVSVDPNGLANDSSVYSAAKVSQATISSEQSMAVTIITDQKDVVTLSFDADFNSSYTTYEGLAKSENGYTKIEGRRFSYGVSIEQSVKVEGDLNKQELRDIQKVMKRIGKMLKMFLAGKMDDVAEKAQKLLENRKSLVSVDTKMEFEKNASVLSQTYAEAARASSSDSMPMIQPVELPAEFADQFKPIDRLTDEMADVVKKSGIKPARMLKEADRLFYRLFKDFTGAGPLNADKMNVTRLIQSDFMKKLEELSSRTFSAYDA